MTRYDQKPLGGDLLDYGSKLDLDGLVGLWLFNEGSGGQVFDLSANDKTGTLAGNAHWDAGFVVCEANGDKISMDTPALIETGTIILLFNGTGTPHENGKMFVTTDAEFQLYREDPGTAINLYINGTAASFTGLQNLWGTGEHIIAVTWDASANERKIYIDGILKGTNTDAFTWDAANLGSTFYIGDRADDQRTIGGRYGWFSAYNRVLSASEIALLYQEPFCMVGRRTRRIVFVEPVAPGVVNMAVQADSVTSSTAGFIRGNRPGAGVADSVSASNAGCIRLNRPLAGVAASSSLSTAGFYRLNIPMAGQAASTTASYAGARVGAEVEELFRNRRLRHTSVYSRRLFKGVF